MIGGEKLEKAFAHYAPIIIRSLEPVNARQKRIRPPLAPYGRHFAVAGINFHIIAERHDFIH